MRATLPFLILLVLAQQCYAAEIEYRTGGSKYDKAWQPFYVEADHESEIDDPLVAKGIVMVPAICEAVKHKDMKRRRYAIGALGYINERAAMPTLKAILSDKSEIDYFRGDARNPFIKLIVNEALVMPPSTNPIQTHLGNMPRLLLNANHGFCYQAKNENA